MAVLACRIYLQAQCAAARSLANAATPMQAGPGGCYDLFAPLPSVALQFSPRLGNLAHRHDPLRVMLMRCLVFLGLKLQLLVQLLLLCEQIGGVLQVCNVLLNLLFL